MDSVTDDSLDDLGQQNKQVKVEDVPKQVNPSLPFRQLQNLKIHDNSSDFDDSVNFIVNQEDTNLRHSQWLEAQKTNNYLQNPIAVSASQIFPHEQRSVGYSESDKKIVETMQTVQK